MKKTGINKDYCIMGCEDVTHIYVYVYIYFTHICIYLLFWKDRSFLLQKVEALWRRWM